MRTVKAQEDVGGQEDGGWYSLLRSESGRRHGVLRSERKYDSAG